MEWSSRASLSFGYTFSFTIWLLVPGSFFPDTLSFVTYFFTGFATFIFVKIMKLDWKNVFNSIHILKFSLSIPILVKQVILVNSFLRHFDHEMQVLLCLESWYFYFGVVIVQNFHPDQPFASHYGLHESKVEAPRNNESQNDGYRNHSNLIIDIS